jgi:hypothetical protein
MVDDHNTSKQIPHRAGGSGKIVLYSEQKQHRQRRRVHFKVREAALQAATLELQSIESVVNRYDNTENTEVSEPV